MLERSVMVSRAAPGTDLAAVFAIIRAAHGRTGRRGSPAGSSSSTAGSPRCSRARAGARRALARIARDPRHKAWRRSRERGSAGSFPARRWRCARAPASTAAARGLRLPAGLSGRGIPADVLVEFLVQACSARRTRGAGARADSIRRGAFRGTSRYEPPRAVEGRRCPVEGDGRHVRRRALGADAADPARLRRLRARLRRHRARARRRPAAARATIRSGTSAGRTRTRCRCFSGSSPGRSGGSGRMRSSPPGRGRG